MNINEYLSKANEDIVPAIYFYETHSKWLFNEINNSEINYNHIDSIPYIIYNFSTGNFLKNTKIENGYELILIEIKNRPLGMLFSEYIDKNFTPSVDELNDIKAFNLLGIV